MRFGKHCSIVLAPVEHHDRRYQLRNGGATHPYGDLTLDPEDPELYFTRGGAHHVLNQLDAAMKDYDTAIEKKPDYGRAYSARGGIKHQGDEGGGSGRLGQG